jgi:PEP-CTERM motif
LQSVPYGAMISLVPVAKPLAQELISDMRIWCYISTIGLLLIGWMPAGWAQALPLPVVLSTGDFIDLFGLKIAVGSTCSIGGTTCSATDGLVLEGVSTGRGTVTFEVANKTAGSNILAATQGGSPQTLSVNFTVTPSGADAGATVSQATNFSISGIDECTSVPAPPPPKTCVAASAVATLGAGFSSPSLTAALPISTTSNAVVTSASSGSSTFSGSPNTFTVSDVLTLNPAGTATSLSAQALVLQLHTVPEPASISVVLMGLGGLVMARRRRRS